jgi:hypothetical protein
MERTKLVRLALALRIVWVFCLLAGTYNHSAILIHYGWNWRYGGMLLILMTIDVANNTWVLLKYGGEVWMVASQWIFLVFVLTVDFVWRAT